MKTGDSQHVSISMRDAPALHETIQKALGGVMDPETGLDVMRMGVVRDIHIEPGKGGIRVVLTFRPSSPVCPMAFKLAWEIKKAAQAVEGIEDVVIKVENYNRAAELKAILQDKKDGGL